MYTYMSNYNYLCYMFFFVIHVYIQLYEYLGIIYTSDNKSVYIQRFEYLYLFICTFIQVIIFICVLNDFSKIKI